MKMTTVALLMEKKQVSKVKDFLSLSNRSLQKSRVTLGTRMEKAPKLLQSGQTPEAFLF